MSSNGRVRRCTKLLLCCAVLGTIRIPVSAADEPTAVLAWFTEATIENSLRLPAPPDAPPAVPGTAGAGVAPATAVPIENPLLRQRSGLISFWIRPNWDGRDGRMHRLLRIGDPDRNGLLVEKAASGMLRYVMASPRRATAARADVSHWKRGEWHQVAIAWFDRGGQPLGLPLWIDRVAVDGPIAAGNAFLDPAQMSDPRLWIGDESTDATLDELILRNRFDTEKPAGPLTLVYRDYFRTAPCERIAIEVEALQVPSDRRVVNGFQKQFGLRAGTGDDLPLVTDFAVRYGQWAEFDAKPLIRWTTSDAKVATVDENGMVTGRSMGTCQLTAEFRGRKASYDVEVIPVEQPDLDLLFVERLPRQAADRAKDRPVPGEPVESIVHVANFGYTAAPAGVLVRFELIPDGNRNFRVDANEKPIATQEKAIAAPLPPRAQETVAFAWTWPDGPTWVRVTVDVDGRVPEICEANNQCCELNTARPLRFAYNPKQLESGYAERKINHVGSFSFYDWINAQKLRFDVMLREAVWPGTSPDGIQDAFRTDNFYELKLGPWEEEPYFIDERYYDGGFPVNEPVNLMAIDAAVLHEFGHTCLAQPDLYGYPMHQFSVLLRDEHGAYYAGGELMPVLSEHDDVLPYSSADGVPCGTSYNSLMAGCHLWLHPAQAGQVQWFTGYRGGRFWGTQGRLIPTREHLLQVYDFRDRPLAGAAVYVYQVTQTGAADAGTKFIADRPKFLGNTDEDGRFTFPDHTDQDWDDPDTDEVEGALPVWNPFGRAKSTTGAPYDVAFTPNVWCVEGLLLIKMVCGEHTEFAWLPLTEFNEAFFAGARIRGVYPVRTSLPPGGGVTPVVRRPVPEAIRKTNLRPKAAAGHSELTVGCGRPLRIDGSASTDPEGQPLVYRWHLRGPGDVKPRFSDQPVYEGTAPPEPAELEAVFYVIDGLRVSEPVQIKVHVVADPGGEAR